MSHWQPLHRGARITAPPVSREQARLLWRTTVLVALLVSCDAPEAPAYDLTLRIHVFDAGDLGFRVDQQPVSGQGTERVTVNIERGYESYQTARNAPQITFEALRSGEVAWTQNTDPAVCAEFESECGDIVSGSLSLCFDASGAPVGLCASLSCSDSHGLCGAWIASPDVEPAASN